MATKSTLQAAPCDRLATLPNELQDMVFAMLDDESQVFISDKRTSASSLRALFAHFCRRRTLNRATLYGHDFEAKVMPELSKLSQIHRTIVKIPSKAADVVELTLVIPVRRKVTNSRFAELVAKLPAAWHGDLLHELFPRLSRVKTLNLLAVYVPRGEHARGFGDLKHESVPSSFIPVPLPSTVRNLRVEEAECSDRLHLHARDSGTDLGVCWSSNIISRITNFTNVEYLHFDPSCISRPDLAFLADFVALRSFRYDDKRRTVLYAYMIDNLCKNLKSLKYLRTLDIRFNFINGSWHQYSNWRIILANIDTVRIPLDAFLDILRSTKPAQSITFDVILDRSLDINACVERNDAELQPGELNLKGVLQAIQALEAWFRLRRKRGVDKRRVTIAQCLPEDGSLGWPMMLYNREEFLEQLKTFQADYSNDG